VALAFNAMNTVPVLADDAPPPTEAVESETLPAEETVEESLEQNPVSETLQDESASDVEGGISPGDDGAEETQNESASDTEEDTSSVEQVTSQLPEDTQLIVVNEQGETLPLVSQEAGDAIELGDPRWCPVGVTPGGAGCTGVFTSFQALLDHLATINEGAGPNMAGVIWIEGTYNSSINDPLATEFVINGNSLTNMANYALTLNGGWAGGTSTALNPNTPSTFEVPLSIIHWNNAVTIRNVVVQNADGVGTAALEVETTGNITLINVDVRNNTTENGGAILTNDLGAGNVAVSDSNFIGNGQPDSGYGLQVFSAGTISLKNVSAIDNSLTGAYLNNLNAVTPKTVTLTGYNFFSHNGGIGLDVRSKGAITLYNVTAMYNGSSGAELNNCQPDFDTETCGNPVASNIVLYGDNNFSLNGADGLRVYSSGTIITYNLTAYGNGTNPLRLAATDLEYDSFGKGVYLHNAFAAVARPINIRGFNTFNGNASTGLFAYSKGLVTVSNLTANDNQCDGSYDTNAAYCAGAYIGSRGVTVTGYGRFVNNDTEGLSVRSWGLVTLNNVYAEGNPSHGVKIETYFPTSANTAVNVAVNGLNFFMDNGGDGLHVFSNGVVTIRSATAVGNGAHGIFVNNTGALAAPGVNLIGLNNASNNGANGVNILSKGAIVVSNLTAIANNWYGAYLDNETPGMLGNVTVSGTNLFVDNYDGGLLVQSHGVVALYNVTASWNGNVFTGGDGVHVDNSNGTASRAVYLYGVNAFNNNYGDGLYVNSLGAIIVYRITANNNDGFGAYLYNQHNKFTSAVVVAGYGSFNNNDDAGLYIASNGNVTTAHLAATYNKAGGVQIDNKRVSTKGVIYTVNVTMNGFNNFSNNSGGNGLTVNSDGTITLSKVTAFGNTGSGAVLDNVGYGTPVTVKRNIVITGLNSFSGNGINGLQFNSSNVFSMTRFSADGNTGSGITGTAYSNITLSCGAINFNGNKGYDLTSTLGTAVITLRGVYSYLDTNVSNKVPKLVRACP
jgi:hypothetical protein